MPNKAPTHKPYSYCRLNKKYSYDQARASAAKRGYGRTWQKVRRRVLRRDVLCQWPGCNELATEVDHIVSKAAGGDNGFSNLQGLCKVHHSTKTVANDGGLGKMRG